MLYSLEQLSSGENAFKKLHSLAKLIVTAVYLVCVASLGKYDLTRLTLFLAYPVLMMAMAQIPWKMILKRAAVAMPFMYSISEGISMGVISYVAINLLSGEYKNKKTSWIVYVLAVIFILKYIYV